MKFLVNVLSTIVGLFVFIMLFFFGLLIMGALFGSDSDEVKVKKDSVINLDLKNITNDYAGKFTDPLVTLFSENASVGLSDIINAIEEAKKDDKIKISQNI